MILFLIGIIEMAIAASWTRSVSRSNPAKTGAITMINIFIWYYVLNQVVNNIDGWWAIVPYAGGCALGAMVGHVDLKTARRYLKRCRKMLRRILPWSKARKRQPRAKQPYLVTEKAYDHLG